MKLDAVEQLRIEAEGLQEEFETEEEHLKNQRKKKQGEMEEAWYMRLFVTKIIVLLL